MDLGVIYHEKLSRFRQLTELQALHLEERENKEEELVDMRCANKEQNTVHRSCFRIQYAAWE
jgi:hypothetical protein